MKGTALAAAAAAGILVAAEHAPAQETKDAPRPAPPAATAAEDPAAAPPAEEGGGNSLATVLDEFVVSAKRRESPLFDSPHSVSRVSMEEIQRERLRRTLTDALLDVPSVMVQKTAYGQASPFLRGFTGYQTVMLVDGIRLNNSAFRSGPNQYWSTIDAFTVESLEIVRGPASVLHGSDAVGGAVNARARRRTEFEPGTHGGLRTVLRAATAERSLVARVEAEGNVDDVGFLAGVTSRNFGDLEAGRGSGHLRATGYREHDGDVRVEMRASPATTWTLAVQQVRQDNVPRTEQTVFSVPFHGTVAGSELKRDLDQERDLAFLRVASSAPGLPWADRVEATLSWHRQAEEQDRDRTGGRTDLQGFEVETLGLQAEAGKETPVGSLTFGVEYWRDSVDSFRRDYTGGRLALEHVQGPVADDASYDLAGLFVQDEIPLGPGVVIPAARFTYAAARAGRVDDPTVAGSDPATPRNVISVNDRWTNVTGSLRTVQPLAEGWNAFGGVSQGFRAPNLSDLTRLDDTSGVETPTPGLDSEEYLGAEAGVRRRGAGWTLQVAAWRTWIDGLIVPSPTGRTIGTTPEVRKDNVGDGWVHGIDVEGTLRLGEDWELSGGVAWARGRVDQLTTTGRRVSAPLSRVAPLTGVLTLRYAPPASDWSAWISGRAADGQDRLSLKDETDSRRIPPGGTPGYAVVSLGVGCRLSENARLSLSIENVFNRDYRIHGSGVNEPGRGLVVALEMTF